MYKLIGSTLVALCIIGTTAVLASGNPECPTNPGVGLTLIGSSAGEKLVGCPEKDAISGMRGNDHIWGGQDGDSLRGGAGEDVIHAIDAQEPGWENDRADQINGGPGVDVCYVSTNDIVRNCEVRVLG